MTTDTKPPGRPTDYTPELRMEICRRLASPRTLRSVCRDDDMPCRETVEDWLIDCDNDEKKDKVWVIDDFLRHYTRARERQADNVHDEIIEIADDSTNDYMEIVKKTKNGEKKLIVFDKEAVMRSKLRVDARFAWLANTAPRKYGKNIVVGNQTLGADGKPREPVAPGSGAGMDEFEAACLAAIEKAEAKKKGD